MATAEEILQTMAEVPESAPVCVIDPETRTIIVPPEYQLFGVENDKRTERLYFQCPKIVGDNQDLSRDYQLFINYQNANGDPDAYYIEDMEVDGDNITFSWLLEENVTKYRGNIQFAFGAIIPGDEAEDPDKNRWNTTINTDCTCLVGLKCTQQVAESNPDALVQIWAAIDELKAGGGGTGGTTNYNNLSNKPQLNGVTLEGNKTLDQVGVLAKNQGANNSGKFLSVGSDGNVVPADAPSGGTVDPEQIKQAVNGYLEENPVSGMTAEQEQQLNQNTTDVADLKSALEQKGLPAGGTLGQVLVKKSDENYDAEWKNVSAGTSDQYFEMVEGGATTANGVSLDITGLIGLIGNFPDYGQWDSMNNWYRVSYNSTSIPVKNGLPAEKIISKSIKGIPYFRAFTDSDSQYATSNTIAFYGCNSDKAIEEEGNQCSLCEKKFVYTPVDQLPDGTSGAGVIVAYPQEKFDYYYIRLDTTFYAASSNTGKYNRLNPTHISAFDSSVLDNPLIEIGTNTEEFLRMKDEYLDGYYKNMFSHDKFKEIFKNYYAQMAPKIGIYQTCGKAIYIGGDSLHDYAGGDGVSAPGFVTTWNQYLGFSVVKNDGYAGSTWSELTGGGGLKRAKDLISNGTVYDVIILAWGTNDDTGGNGTIDDPASDAEGATMVAVMKWIITNLRNTFKSTAIGVIIPPPKNTEDGMDNRGDLMVQVCELLHVPYVDMREYISISDLGGDTVHLGTGAGKYGAAEASLILRICHYGDTLYPGTTD